MGIKVVIGPVFYESLTYLDEMKDLTFLSLTNKTLDLPKKATSLIFFDGSVSRDTHDFIN